MMSNLCLTHFVSIQLIDMVGFLSFFLILLEQLLQFFSIHTVQQSDYNNKLNNTEMNCDGASYFSNVSSET